MKEMVTGERRPRIRPGALCIVLMLAIVPCVSAAVTGTDIPHSTAPNSEDNPADLASLKGHIAYVCEIQDASMTGTIRYVDTISSGAGTVGLQQFRDDYLVTAASIPLMKTNAEITKARDDLREETRLFSEETKARLIQYNGSTTILRNYTHAATRIAEKALADPEHDLWLANESARLTVFNRDTANRLSIIRTLTRQGINTTEMKNLSLQIDAERAPLVACLTNQSSAALREVNGDIRTLSHDFREQVAAARSAREIALKRDAMMAMG